jgi:hypothetical protein
MATITTTTTSNLVIARERGDRVNPGLQSAKKPVGAEPTRRTIAHGVGSYDPESELNPSDLSAPHKLSLRRSAATVAISGTEKTCRSAFTPTRQLVGAEPTRRTIAHSLGSYDPGSELAPSDFSVPHKLSLRRSVATAEISSSTIATAARGTFDPTKKPLRAYASCNLSLRRCAATVAISSSKITTTAHVAPGPSQKNSASSAHLRALCVQKVSFM